MSLELRLGGDLPQLRWLRPRQGQLGSIYIVYGEYLLDISGYMGKWRADLLPGAVPCLHGFGVDVVSKVAAGGNGRGERQRRGIEPYLGE